MALNSIKQNLKGFSDLKKRLELRKKEMKKNIPKQLEKSMMILQNQTGLVIRGFNMGTIERFVGDFSERQERNAILEARGRKTNNPLRDTGALAQQISFSVRPTTNGATGILTFNARSGLGNYNYPKFLNDGVEGLGTDWRIRPYHFTSLALKGAKKDILKQFRGG